MDENTTRLQTAAVNIVAEGTMQLYDEGRQTLHSVEIGQSILCGSLPP
jgi:hypothetical protein